MNWEAIGAIGELLGASAVVITLVYLAMQVKHAKAATAGQSRLYRATAVREIVLKTIEDDDLRTLQTLDWGLEPYYAQKAEELGLTLKEVTKIDWGHGYYYWMWWGQYSSTTEKRDLEELGNIITKLGALPGMKKHWEESPLSRPLLDTKFVAFVDDIFAKSS